MSAWYVPAVQIAFRRFAHVLVAPHADAGVHSTSFPRITSQEDAHIVSLDLGDPHATGLFAVFDGHGGKVRRLDGEWPATSARI